VVGGGANWADRMVRHVVSLAPGSLEFSVLGC